MKETNCPRRKSVFISRYKSKLNYLYGDIDKVLNEGYKHKRITDISHTPQNMAVTFDSTLLNREIDYKLRTINNYIATLSERK